MPSTSSSPDVAIIIVSYNVCRLLEVCLDSVFASLARTPDVFAEVWVIDNASADGSASMVTARFPAVRLIANQENPGFAAANNQAIERTSARHLLLLNPDTAVRDDAIAHLVRFLDSHPEVGAAGCRLVYPDDSFQHSSFAFPSLAQVLLDFYPLHHRLIESRVNGRYPRASYDRVMEVGHPLGACLIVRRRAIDQIGTLDEDYFMYCEELDLCWRLKRAGWRIYHTPGATVVHHGAQSTQQFRGPMLIALHRSRLRFFERHYGCLFAWVVRQIVRAYFGWAISHTTAQRDRGLASVDDARERIETYHVLARL
jgi:N-acetylglucosaminyl-diphospho-decaprenol L-rhamnosyltransferase